MRSRRKQVAVTMFLHVIAESPQGNGPKKWRKILSLAIVAVVFRKESAVTVLIRLVSEGATWVSGVSTVVWFP